MTLHSHFGQRLRTCLRRNGSQWRRFANLYTLHGRRFEAHALNDDVIDALIYFDSELAFLVCDGTRYEFYRVRCLDTNTRERNGIVGIRLDNLSRQFAFRLILTETEQVNSKK